MRRTWCAPGLLGVKGEGRLAATRGNLPRLERAILNRAAEFRPCAVGAILPGHSERAKRVEESALCGVALNAPCTTPLHPHLPKKQMGGHGELPRATGLRFPPYRAPRCSPCSPHCCYSPP